LEKFFSCEEIAVRYAVKITTVWEWIRRGDLPAIKIGKQYRIRASDLEAFERDNRTGLIDGGDGGD
jgi:excisionase family DNA binding protein